MAGRRGSVGGHVALPTCAVRRAWLVLLMWHVITGV